MTTYDAPVPFAAAPTRRGTARRWGAWHTGLLLVCLGAALLTTWAVWTAQPSDYYASIALSMSRSWQNFFFGAVDPAGTVTLDKIPGSFWIPALFVKAFGYSAWAVVLPNALAAVGAVALIAITVKRMGGATAGILAGAVVATTPILVAVARSNQPETFFVLGLAAVAWAAMHALTRRSLGWLLVAGLLIAASFQTYMLEAWAVWPALAAAWLCTRGPLLSKLWRLAVAGAVSLAASVSWIVVVSLVPSSERPYIGSTLNDSAWEMVFGYNGLGRFGSATADSGAYRSFTPSFSGSPGVLRLFTEQLAGQIGWLLPTAVAAVVVLWVLRFSWPVTVLVTVWLATFAAMFSVVAGMHQFYTAALAVPMALTIALAFGAAHRAARTWPQVLLTAVAAVTALGIGLSSGGYSVPVALVQAVAAVSAIVLLLRVRRGGWPTRRVGRALTAGAAGAALLLTPLAWSIVTIAHPNPINPVAGGVSEMSGFGGGRGGPGMSGTGDGAFGAARDGGRGAPGETTGGMPQGGAPADGAAPGDHAPGSAPGGQGLGSAASGSSSPDTALLTYLQERTLGSRYLAATFGAQAAASLILDSDGGSFLPIGGFDGGDPVPTLAAFQQLVADGDLRYVILSSTGRGGFAMNGGADADTGVSAEIRAWVVANCSVPSDAPDSSLYACS